MRFVIRTSPGVVELNYMWLPTFLGLDPHLKKELEKELAPMLEKQEMTDEVLQAASDHAVDFICKRYAALTGLRDYLDAVKFVQDGTAPTEPAPPITTP